MSELVSTSGYAPIVASGGREALQKVEAERPDLILLDINMPDMDGWTVLRQLKEKGLTDTVKIMMLTATTEIGTDIFGLQDVVFGYIRKPFNNAELSERLKDALEEKVKPPVETKPAVEEKKPSGRFKLFGKAPAQKEPAVEHEGMEKAKKSAKEYDLRKGFAYLVRETKPTKSFDIFVDQVTHNIQGLCVTRQHPSVIRKEWGLEKTPIIWLSNQLGKVYVNPTNIGILSDTIIRFVEKSGDSIVLIDGVEFLIVNNDFEKVLRMIHHITEAVMEYKSRLIISVDPRTLNTRELALLERNMEIIDALPSDQTKT
ncbi:MAG: response regulator PleD [Methanomassiliicoccales archaeon PtaU1.Bin124]|nr:MAG: response regulator PleD [Methanomassiliicoccales archaeon PtaU1.Bin124]